MIYSIAKKYGLHSEIKNMKKIRGKSSNKDSYSSSDVLDSDLLLDSNSSWDTYICSNGRKEMNMLDQVVTDNLNNYRD